MGLVATVFFSKIIILKMWVFILILVLISFYRTNQSLSVSSIKNKIKVKKLEDDINSIKYPKSSLKGMNKLNKDDYTIKNFRQEAEQNLINIKNEENEMQKMTEELKQLEINRDILIKITKNQNAHFINPAEFEDFTRVYANALKKTKTGYGLNYTNIASLSDELHEQTKIFQFWSTSYLNSQIKIDKFNKIEFGNIIAYGSVS